MATPGETARGTQFVLIWMAVAAFCHGSAMVEAASPRGDERVKSIWLFDVASDLPFCADAAVADSQGLFVAGHAWRKADGERLWLWRIDRAGKRLWEKELTRPKIAEEIKIVALLKPADDDETNPGVPNATVVIGQGQQTIVRSYDSQGEVSDEVTLAGKNYASGAARFPNGDLLVFGTEMQRIRQATPACAARFNRKGKQLWRLKLDPTVEAKRIVPWARPVLSPGQVHINHLQGATILGDGSAVLVGVTGDLNKFGQGPSNLWLVRVSGDGEQLAQTLVKDGRFAGGTKDLIVRRGEDVLVPYTTAPLPGFGTASTTTPPSSGGRLACFDVELNSLWEKPLPNSALPGAVAICGQGPYAMLSESADDVTVRAVDGEGEELWASKVEAPGSSVFPVSIIEGSGFGVQGSESRVERAEDGRTARTVIAVCNYSRHQGRTEKERPGPQVMVITIE